MGTFPEKVKYIILEHRHKMSFLGMTKYLKKKRKELFHVDKF
jgi:hypothetical protein